MFESLQNFGDQYKVVFGLILATSLAMSALLYLLRGRTLARSPRKDHRFAPEIFSLFASMYAFFLGFSIVTLWSNYTATKSCVVQEAGALLTTYRLSQTLDGSGAFQSRLMAYARSVVDDEWKTMNATDNMSLHASEQLSESWREFIAMKPADKGDMSLYTSVGTSLTEVSRNRQLREQALQGNLYAPIWVILIFGALAVLLGLFLSNPEQTKSQVCMEVIVVFLILSCLFFIQDIDTPFSGIITISSRSFTDAHAAMLTLAGAAP
ncbi:DUF4239 domain-containing protein [Fundidesulfovibrio agrisoli]|uniref:bestrophin-like domain n=1 Tax=Fundidesulfovibrio agrisoli TaxID=2922717 RepID=UPI001FADA805|nr:DUF4239 domain-containing protein [Fundidesulfovibrio agrisoli]